MLLSLPEATQSKKIDINFLLFFQHVFFHCLGNWLSEISAEILSFAFVVFFARLCSFLTFSPTFYITFYSRFLCHWSREQNPPVAWIAVDGLEHSFITSSTSFCSSTYRFTSSFICFNFCYFHWAQLSYLTELDLCPNERWRWRLKCESCLFCMQF